MCDIGIVLNFHCTCLITSTETPTLAQCFQYFFASIFMAISQAQKEGGGQQQKYISKKEFFSRYIRFSTSNLFSIIKLLSLYEQL